MRIFDGANDSELREAGAMLMNGGIVVIPTETVYGLAADTGNPAAIERIYAVKGRPETKPLPVLVAYTGDAARFCGGLPDAARELMERFWPGPLTLVVPKNEGTVALRCPDHPAALAVLRYAGVPLVLTSANLSGEKPPQRAEDVQLQGIDGIVDGGACAVGYPSTILNVTCEPPECLRYGAPVIGVTGGSGAGKSAVLEVFRQCGAEVIRADDVYHDLLANHVPLQNELHSRFGTADRAGLRGIVFQDEQALSDLNAITHKYVIAEIRQEMARLAIANLPLIPPLVIEAIALLESGTDQLCSVTVAVTAPQEKRVRRIVERDGLTLSDALARISNQKPDTYYTENCTAAIENNGSEQDLAEQTQRLWDHLIKE